MSSRYQLAFEKNKSGGLDMKAIEVRTPETAWLVASQIFGARQRHEGREMVRLKILSDRCAEGGGVAYLLNVQPPPGRIVKTIAIARSDEHVYVLDGGYCNKAGELIHLPGDYILNPMGHPHGVFVATETTTLVICRGEPDEVSELCVIEPIERAAGCQV
jgi:hypothetical protein